MKKNKLFKRTVMTILFLWALYTTLSSVMNVSAVDLRSASSEAATDNKVIYRFQQSREVALTYKKLNHLKAKTRYISSQQVEQPKTLEEAINVEQYPSRIVTATGYTAGEESTGKTPDHPGYGITYSGVKVKRDLYSTIAADLSVFPLGTILFIPGYGYGVVADKGSAITGNKIDLFFPTVEDVYEKWGKKEVEVYVIKKGNGELTEDVLTNLNETEALQVFREQVSN